MLALAAWVALSFAAAAPGIAWPPGEWYAQLAKPAWTPPNWVFGPVWTALYAMMGVAAWRVWRRGGFAKARGALPLFLAQLALNAAWTPAFFGLHLPGVAFAIIAVLWLAIAATARAFLRHDRVASLLLLPYLVWVSYAAALNLALWRMN
ncbi:MAG: tryptophan-rich sensory protein [Betaproteobacteria bacterium]|nr:tryptophan-rich sensory protein [Betaproteobacteria bacterium]